MKNRKKSKQIVGRLLKIVVAIIFIIAISYSTKEANGTELEPGYTCCYEQGSICNYVMVDYWGNIIHDYLNDYYPAGEGPCN